MEGDAPLSPSVKRKFSEACHEDDERQSILDISLCKLRSDHPCLPRQRSRPAEPNLHRSVLIFNTLRHLELELRQEGLTVPAAAARGPSSEELDTLDSPPELIAPPSPAAAAAVEDMSDDDDDDDDDDEVLSASMGTLSCQSPKATPVCPPVFPLATHPDSALDRTNSEPLYAVAPGNIFVDPKKKSSSTSESNEPCSPVHKLVAFSEPPSLGSSDYSPVYREPSSLRLSACASDILLNSAVCSFTSLLDSEPPPAASFSLPSVKTCRSSSPSFTASLLASATAATQDPFSDLDLSVYDFDLLSSFSPSLKVSPPSVEELMHSVEPMNAPRNSCIRSEDIDHIMQVLVNI